MVISGSTLLVLPSTTGDDLDGHYDRHDRDGVGLCPRPNLTRLRSHPDSRQMQLIIAALFPVMRWVLDKTLYHYVTSSVFRLSPDSPNYAKFKESLYKMLVQVAFTVAIFSHRCDFRSPTQIAAPTPVLSTALYFKLLSHSNELVLLLYCLLFRNKAWFTDPKLCYSDCVSIPCVDQVSTMAERFIYRLEGAFYLQAIPMLFLWETKRHDRWQIFAHHVATVILIGYSYYLNLLHIGILVLACHELNDIFLEMAKMARYAALPEWTSTVLFIGFAVSWFVTRIYAFGFIVIRSTLFDTRARAIEVGQTLGLDGAVDIEPHASILNGLLIFLYALHVYWSYLIVQIIIKALTPGGKLDDIREEGTEGKKKS